MPTNQPSRKGKKAWRKNVDITEVGAGLEQLRDEIIQGGVIKEKPDSQLFSLDTTGDRSVAKKIGPKLKCDEILSARSAIPAIEGRRRTAVGVVKKKKKTQDWLPYKEVSRLRDVASGVEQAVGKGKESAGGVDYDPWGVEEKPSRLDCDQFSFLEAPEPVKEPKTLKFAPVSLAATGKAVPAVRVPEGGISYNPRFSDWDKLLKREGEKEVEAEKKRLEEAAEADRIKALAAVPDPEEEEEEEEAQETEEAKVEKTSTKRPERKTQAQRNKIARRKELARRQLAETRMKRQIRELAFIKKYSKDIDSKNQLRMQKKPEIEDDEKNPKLMRKRKFGKAALPKPPLELQLLDELSSSFRTLKPEGSLLKDRFRSLRERGVLETRLPVTQHRKRQRKFTERWSYKDFK